MQVLLTNDDGIFAPGLDALRRHAGTLGDVCVVAPAEQQSGSSHSINLYQPIEVREAHRDGEFVGHMVRGTPVDCVKLAVSVVLEQKPDVIISGINDRANFGISVLYSGTVAAAIEGALMGIHSIAVSVAEDGQPNLDYAAELAVDLAREATAHPRPKPVLLNVNVPALPRDQIKGVKWIRHNVAPYTERFRRVDAGGDWAGYQIHGVTGPREQFPGDDVAALIDGYVTVTPLRVDFTDHDALAERENGM
jgi:5'-nucleotidase